MMYVYLDYDIPCLVEEFQYFRLGYVTLAYQLSFRVEQNAMATGAVEYTDCTSAEG